MAADRRDVPDAVAALLTVKIGEVSRTSRKHLAVVNFPFLLSEGFGVFSAKANACTSRELQNFRGEPHIRQDLALYMRPGAHSKQAELVELTDSNFEARVARSYRNYLKRKTDEPFQCEVYVYVMKASDLQPKNKRQRSKTGSGQVATAVEYESLGTVDVNGPPGFEQEAVGGKRKRAEENGIQPPYFQTLQTQHGEGYHTVRMILNGTVVPVQVNVQDLFACMTGMQQQVPDSTGVVLHNAESGAEADQSAAENDLHE